jgi:hypothetical protein
MAVLLAVSNFTLHEIRPNWNGSNANKNDVTEREIHKLNHVAPLV